MFKVNINTVLVTMCMIARLVEYIKNNELQSVQRGRVRDDGKVI